MVEQVEHRLAIRGRRRIVADRHDLQFARHHAAAMLSHCHWWSPLVLELVRVPPLQPEPESPLEPRDGP